MLKRIGRDLLIVLGLVILWTSTSRTTMQFISDSRDNEKWWGKHQFNHGDLASMSYLDYLNKFNSSLVWDTKKSDYHGQCNAVLFLHGDSYTWKLADSVFSGICAYKFIGWAGSYKYKLDKTKKNILVIEASEHLLRNYYGTTQIIDQLHDTTISSYSTTGKTPHGNYRPRYSSFLPDLKINDLFNKYINQNIQFNLFNYNFITPMFGTKAAINLYLFDRASGNVVISNDKEYLFLGESVDRESAGSSCSPLAKEEIDHLVSNFNTIYDYYKTSGFKEIYLSIIPNTVSVVQPEEYNNLIPQIQSNPRLKMKVIDMYSVLKRSPGLLLAKGDTHWNSKGRQVWVDMVNNILTNNTN